MNYCILSPIECGDDSVPAGTFRGDDSVPAGTFRGDDSVPAGTFR